MLAVALQSGVVRIFETREWKVVQELRDPDVCAISIFITILTLIQEKHAEEFFCVKFSPDMKVVFAAGVQKYRDQFSPEENDLTVASGVIKVRSCSSCPLSSIPKLSLFCFPFFLC